ncbi:MAG: insulinase family protein [Methylovulum sp.]|nr:insulinase family protein [Methylovulum sp.]
MRSLFSILAVIFFSPTLLAAAPIQHWQTAQGSQVYYVHTEGLPMVDIQVVFDAGSVREANQWGVASLTADLLESGAGQWQANAIAERFERVGAIFSSGSSIDTASVSLRTLTDKPLFESAIDTLRVLISQPRFDDADFQREKNRSLAGLKQQQESPAEMAGLAFYEALYGSHPYGHPSSGTLATVAALNVNDVRAFYKSHYVAANAMVVIVGDLSKQQAEQTAITLVKDLPLGKVQPPVPEVTLPAQARSQHIDFPSTQTHVLVGIPGTYRNDPDYFDLYVGNHILGGGGLVSKLFDEVREKRGLAYSASSTFIPMLKPGPFIASLQTRNDQTTQALQVLQDTLTHYINNGPTEAELQAAKKNIIGGFAMRFDTNKELANYVAMIGFYHLPLDYLDNFQQKISQVTVTSITHAFKQHVPVNQLQTITVGKSAK